MTDQATGVTYPSAPIHRTLWDIHENVLVILPRGSGKTTVVSKAKILHALLYELEPDILLLTSKGLGEEIVGAIRRELEINPLILFLFGRVVPKDQKIEQSLTWRQRELSLKTGPRLRSVTPGEPIRGKRPTWIVIDDPQERKDVLNPRLAKAFYEWFLDTVYPSLNPKGHIEALGTIIHPLCFLNLLKADAKDKGFRVIEQPAILNWSEDTFTGTSFWPERFSLEYFQTQYKTIGPRAFRQEFQHEPGLGVAESVFDLTVPFSIIQPIRTDGDLWIFKEPPWEDAVMGLDLAEGRVGRDLSTMIARSKEGELLAEYRGYITQDRFAEKMEGISRHAKNLLIVPERNSALLFLSEARKYPYFSSMYKETTIDRMVLKDKESIGFHTTAVSKRLVIAELEARMRTENFQISEREAEEIQHFVYTEAGGMEAITPHHDDLIMADALCIHGIARGIRTPKLTWL